MLRTKKTSALLTTLLAALLSGCATTQVRINGHRDVPVFCQAPGQSLEGLLLWTPNWRLDQKDVPLREQAAAEGLERFAADSRCFAKTTVRRWDAPAPASPSDAAVLAQIAGAGQRAPDRVLIVTVRELGPVIQILGPIALFGGGTEVVLDLESRDPRSGALLARIGTHWSNGGSFVFKGVRTLPQDMQAALSASLQARRE